jgi:hypothetical protein
LSSAWLSLHLPFSSTVGFEKFFSAVALLEGQLGPARLRSLLVLRKLPKDVDFL